MSDSISVAIIADELVEKVDLGQISPPADWSVRCLYAGAEGARNWLAVVGEPSFDEHAHAPYGLRPLCVEAIGHVRAGTLVALGPGDGYFDRELVRELKKHEPELAYIPVEISRKLLETSIRCVESHATVPVGILADFERNQPLLRDVLDRYARRPILFILLGGTVCNLDLGESHFFAEMRALMHIDDSFLIDFPLTGPAWTADQDPRLDQSQYTDDLKRFLARGLAHRDHDLSTDNVQEWFHDRIECTVSLDCAIAKTKLFSLRDRQTGDLLLRIRLYDWDAVRDWLRRAGFDLSFAQCSLSSSMDQLGMGAILLTRQDDRQS